MKDKLFDVTKKVIHALDTAGVTFIFPNPTLDDETVDIDGHHVIVQSAPSAQVGELSVLLWAFPVMNCQPALSAELGKPDRQWFTDEGNVRMSWKLDGIEVTCGWHIVDISVRFPL